MTQKPLPILLVLGACALTSSLSAHAAATATPFSGPGDGEGLDLTGNFTYAVNVGTGGAAGKVRDAKFTADNVAGVTVSAANEIANWLTASYGDTTDDNNLETVLRSIRWNAAPDTVKVTLAVETGAKYKLQLLFGESCCRGRAFDVKIEGNLEVDEFNPAGVQGDDLAAQGAVVTYEFTAADDQLDIELDGNGIETPEYNDHNAILNGFTLERLSVAGDSDGDGLTDEWEKRFFGNLSQDGNGDFDNDGVKNSQELSLGLSPNDKDTDKDGLEDGAELNVHKSDPAKSDTDGDLISDGDEVNVYKTNPASLDSDQDGFGDYAELRLMTNPADKNDIPKHTSVGGFTGGDPGEGLDLAGNFTYALNVGGEEGSTAGSANFVPLLADEVPGVLLEAGNHIPAWHAPEYGDTAADDGLEVVLRSIRWSNAGSADVPAVVLTLGNLEVGAEYKAQLLFAEACCAGRAFDVSWDNQLIVDEFNPSIFQNGPNNPKQGAVITHSFIARASKAVFKLDGRTISTVSFGDHNAIFNGATLELIRAKADTDNDGLPDAWEQEVFGNLSKNASSDDDGDGIKNSDEFAAVTDPSKADTDGDGLNDGVEKTKGTNPLVKDSDGDGLSDGDEVNTYKSDPLVADSDADGLSDGLEVTRYKSDPTKRDSDGDGFEDRTEVFSRTDPASASSKPDKTLVAPFTGGDPGEGLDLTGNFLYALNIGGVDGGQVQQANFIPASASDAPEGVTVEAVNEIQAWHAPAYGDTANDDVLETIMQSIRWSAAPAKPTVTLSKLKPGNAYKIQLLFAESCCSRGFDVLINGQLVADDFAPFIIQDRINNQAVGAFVAHTFVATTDTVAASLDGTTAPYSDHNPTLSAVTLEDLGVAPADIRVTVAATGGSLRLTWTGGSGTYVVERKNSLSDATWTRVTSTTERTATVPISGNSGFFRVSQ